MRVVSESAKGSVAAPGDRVAKVASVRCADFGPVQHDAIRTLEIQQKAQAGDGDGTYKNEVVFTWAGWNK